MYQTEYLPLQNIDRVHSGFTGGLCAWWFVPVEWLAGFPEVDPLTQQLTAEPVLLSDKSWLGPVRVPDEKLGWSQTTQRAKAGVFYKQQVEGFLAGIDQSSYINLGNLANHQFCVVGKLRASGLLIVIGNDIAGLDITDDTTSGTGSKDTPGTKITFTGETIGKASVLPAFFISDPFPFLVDFDDVAIEDFDGEIISSF